MALQGPFRADTQPAAPYLPLASVEGEIDGYDVRALNALATEPGTTTDIPDHIMRLPLVRMRTPLVIESTVHGHVRRGYGHYGSPQCTPREVADQMLPHTVQKMRLTGEFDVTEYIEGLFIAQAVVAATQEADRAELQLGRPELSAVGTLYSDRYEGGKLPLIHTVLIDISRSADSSTGYRFDG